jgi:MbtH protein
MANPFEVPTANYVVLVNDEDQHSLWPDSAEIPAGWTVTHGPTDRQSCLDHITATWTDLRPRSVRAAAGQSS